MYIMTAKAYEKEYMIRLEREEKHQEEFLTVIQELIDERDAQTESQDQSEVQTQYTTKNSAGVGKSRKKNLEEYEKKYLDRLTEESRENAEMIKKAEEIVTKRF